MTARLFELVLLLHRLDENDIGRHARTRPPPSPPPTSRHRLKTSSMAGRRNFGVFSATSINALSTVSSSELARLCPIV
jgi:hypothetical protein